jgi:hypothetical protein
MICKKKKNSLKKNLAYIHFEIESKGIYYINIQIQLYLVYYYVMITAEAF